MEIKKKRGDEIRLILSRCQIRGFLALAILAGASYALMSESFTLSTYYPAPSGVYNRIITTTDAYLARDGGKVGIRTTSPQYTLDVNGSANVAGNSSVGGTLSVAKALQLAALPDPDPPGQNGMVYYNTTRSKFRGFQNGAWTDLGAAQSCPAGYTGAACSTPVCSAGCQNGGTCAAPDTCSCPAGYSGPTCGNACQSAVTAAGPCAPGVCCGACVDGNWFAYGSYCGTSSSGRCCWNSASGKGSCHYCR